jgi:hypothetical protein
VKGVTLRDGRDWESKQERKLSEWVVFWSLVGVINGDEAVAIGKGVVEAGGLGKLSAWAWVFGEEEFVAE